LRHRRYQKGGSAEDIFEGVLVGAAVGGWAAFLTVVAGEAGAGSLAPCTSAASGER